MKRIIQRLFPNRVNELAAAVPRADFERPVPKEILLERAQQIRNHLLENLEGITIDIGDKIGRNQLAVRGSINANIDLIFLTNTADIGHVDVELGVRGQGRCRRFVQQLHDGIRDAGFEKMSLKAVRDGRVAWAALGFRPTPAAWELRKSSFMSGFRQVRNHYPVSVATLIDRLIGENDYDAFPVLANIAYRELNRAEYRMIAETVMSNLTDWDGEFIVNDRRYLQYLFR